MLLLILPRIIYFINATLLISLIILLFSCNLRNSLLTVVNKSRGPHFFYQRFSQRLAKILSTLLECLSNFIQSFTGTITAAVSCQSTISKPFCLQMSFYTAIVPDIETVLYIVCPSSSLSFTRSYATYAPFQDWYYVIPKRPSPNTYIQRIIKFREL